MDFCSIYPGQTFVTSCDDTAFLKTDGEVYRMNGGVLSKA